MLFNEELIYIDLDIRSKGALLTFLGTELEAGGYVTSDFSKKIMEREQHFPTGLPTMPYGIAIPHTADDHVLCSKIAFASLKEPVRFKEMGTDDKEIDVSIVFMLALQAGQEHMQMLAKLMERFQDQRQVARLKNLKQKEDVAGLLNAEHKSLKGRE